MGVLIMLIKAQILCIEGERDETDAYKSDTVSFKINPAITCFFNAGMANETFNSDEIIYRLKKDNILEDILNWEKINYGYEKMLAKYGDSTDDAIQTALEQLKNDKEAIEMELQRSDVVIGSEDSIGVKTPPNIL